MNKTSLSDTRNQTMDFLKGIGIIYVVLGHTLVNPMHNFIYLFHMPLFYFISGYFYNDIYSHNPLLLTKNRIKTLYIPFLKYQLLFLIFHNFFFKIYIYSDKAIGSSPPGKIYNAYDFLINFLQIITFSSRVELLGAFWFFTVLFTINIAFCVIRFSFLKIFKTSNELWPGLTISLLYISGSFLKYHNVTLPRQIERSLMALMIFYIGYLYKKNQHRISINKSIAIICFFTLCIGTAFSENYFFRSLPSLTFTWLIFALCGIYMNVYIAQSPFFKNNKLINRIGSETIIIMGLHFLSFKIINLIKVLYYNYPPEMIASFPVIDASNGWWIPYTLTGIFVPLMYKWIYTNSKNYFVYKLAQVA